MVIESKSLYDRMSRLRSAVYGERSDLSNKVNRFNESVDEYSRNGSIKHLVRRGKKNDGEYGKIDNLHAYYDGNQLQRVEDNAIKLLYNGSMDFKDSGDSEVEYTYNDNGALTSDKNRGIALIEYDNSNNPKRVQFTNGNVTEYIYTATGQKLRTIHYTATSNITVPMGTTHTLTQNETQSIDSTDYLLGGTYRLTNGMRSMYLFPGGYCNLNDPTVTGTGNPSTDSISYHYYNKDHLGNNREVISENGQVEQIVHYYPFGTPFTDGSSTNIGLQPYLYGNKELDMMHGLNTYDFGARNYNPLLPMWDKVDPKASDYPGLSPYGYCALNPINAVDPNGKDSYLIFWSTSNGRYGHAAIGIDNYKYDTNLNKYVPDGTITTYGLFPLDREYNSDDAIHNRRVRGIFYVDNNATLNDIIDNNFYSNENVSPDGIIQIHTTYETDKDVENVIKSEIDSNQGYKGRSRNCATFAREGVRAALKNNVSGEESFMWLIYYVTPNQLFKDTRKFDNIDIILDPGTKVNEKFIEP